MRRFLATMPNCAAGLTPALFALALLPVSTDTVRSDDSVPIAAAPTAAAPEAPVTACATHAAHDVVHEADSSSGSEADCPASGRAPAEIAQARTYVVETATPGYTMTLQGPELAIERLHPEFVIRLANAIREARNAGLPFAGVFSAYRPPAFGVGGFSDKFNSLHTYGLAVDMTGIGQAGSPEAKLWHEIAARNGVVCPYGPRHRAEWNHCQPTSIKIIVAANPLRETVTAAGPADLEDMFEAGNRVIATMASAADFVYRAEATAKGSDSKREVAAKRGTKGHVRTAARASGKSARHAKVAARAGAKGKSAAARAGAKGKSAAAEEGRRKSKSGRG
jgi:hypothetical protein